MTLFQSQSQTAPMALTATLMTLATTLITGTKSVDIVVIHDAMNPITTLISCPSTGSTVAMIGVSADITAPMMLTNGGSSADTTFMIAAMTCCSGGRICPITSTITGMIALMSCVSIGMMRFRACTRMPASCWISGAAAAITMENI